MNYCTVIGCVTGIISAIAGVICACNAVSIRKTAIRIKDSADKSDAIQLSSLLIGFKHFFIKLPKCVENNRTKGLLHTLHQKCKLLIYQIESYCSLFSDITITDCNELKNELDIIVKYIDDALEDDELDIDMALTNLLEEHPPKIITSLIEAIINDIRNSLINN